MGVDHDREKGVKTQATRRIDCFGGLLVARRGERVRLTSRKARLLLVLLASAGRRGLSRHRLATLLWETSGADQARTSLRQALLQIRRAAGDGWIEADGDVLRLAPVVSSDVAEFLSALERNDLAAAARRYRGAFAEGIDVAGLELSQALGTERARFERLASGALRGELERLEESPEAAGVAHALLAIDPLDESAHRCLMAIDAARGARGAARKRFQALDARLRGELGVAPEPETRALHDRIRYAVGSVSRRESPASEERVEVEALVLIALAAEEDVDWDRLAREATDAGATLHAGGPGETILSWRSASLRTVSSLALELARSAGKTLSFGIAPGDPSSDEGLRGIAPARRIAALAEPGSVHVEPGLAVRLGLAPDPARRPVRLPEAPAAPRATWPIIGRDFELAQIEAAIGAARAAGRGLAVHVSGEAGIGKSRLAAEIVGRAAADGMLTATVGFDALVQGRDLAQRLATVLPDTPAGPDRNAFDRAVRRWLTETEVEAETETETELRLSALSPEERRRRALDVLAERIEHAAGHRGALVVVEDCHWAPVGAADFLLDLSRCIAGMPVTLLLTERPHEASLGRRFAVRGHPDVLSLSLTPLPEEAASRLATLVAPDAPCPGEAVARSAGHPLFLIRLLESRWSAGPLPATVSALVLEQIERLPHAQRETLRRAAVLGLSFDPADVAAIFAGTEIARPSGDLLHATDSGLAFGHDLVREAIYDAIPEGLRQAWHGQAARHFRTVDPLRWAHHALRGGDDAEACRAAATAANAMITSRRLLAARPFIEAGLARGGDPEAVAELHSCRAGIRRIRGDLAGALDDYRAAHASALADVTRVAMLVRQALVLHRLGRGTEADRALDDAEAIAGRIGLSGLGRAEIHEQRGNRAFARGDHAACLAYHEAGLAAAEATADPRGIARAHGGIGDAHYAAGRVAMAFRHFQRTIDMAEAGGLGVVREEYLFMRGFALFFAEPGPKAHVLADVAVESAVQCGAERMELLAREVRAQMRLMADDFAGLDEDMAILEAASAKSGEKRFGNDVETIGTWLHFRRGELAAAKDRLLPLLDSADDNSDNGGTILALAANLADAPEERDAYIARGRERLARGALCHSFIWYHLLVLERAGRDGDRELSERHRRALRDYTAGDSLGLVDLVLRTADGAFGDTASGRWQAHLGELHAARLDYLARFRAPPGAEMPWRSAAEGTSRAASACAGRDTAR